MSEMKLLCFSA